jgi:signal transduction histidine kinase
VQPPVDLQADLAAVARIGAVPTILEVVCRTTGMGFAAVARVTEQRWVACAVRDEIQFGLQPGGELKVATTICNEIRDSGNLVVIDHVAADQQFCAHPTPAMYGFQSYISVPIRRQDGSFFGTLCAIDPNPARLNTPQTVGMFNLFAELIGLHLDMHEQLAISQAALSDERHTSELREQFIAVLGHDLRNPLAAIDAGARLLAKEPLNDKSRTILGMMQSSVQRMSGLINNLLGFARARLGGGVLLERTDLPLQPVLDQVITELRAVWPARTITTEYALNEPVLCDPARIAQLFSNLLANALSHGAANGAVAVHAQSGRGRFELSVSNPGEPIPPDTLAQLFQPFFRADPKARQQGLGLGLYISAEIARAHGGQLQATSTAEETRFALTMPSRAAD